MHKSIFEKLRWGKWQDVGQSAQIFYYKMNKFWGSNVQDGDYS